MLIDVPGTSPADGALLLHSGRRHYCLVGGHVDASCNVFRSKLFKAAGLHINPMMSFRWEGLLGIAREVWRTHEVFLGHY